MRSDFTQQAWLNAPRSTTPARQARLRLNKQSGRRRFTKLILSLLLVPVLSGQPTPAFAASPPIGDFFATASVTESWMRHAPGDGDLWPNCWSDDDHVYSAHGDGKGFGSVFSDIGVNRVAGMPGNLSGTTLALGNAVGQVWSGSGYTRKPTGMVCVNGDLYLAVQDLALDFNDAPAATIARSTDKGRTWTWDRSGPMFPGGLFTTIMFLDYGKDNANAIDGYVYAYGLDRNWRDSFDNTVPDPVDMYLARVPNTSIMNRAAWQFYTGSGWSGDINAKRPVLHDDRRVYPNVYSNHVRNLSVLGQGGVVYNKPLNRYIYTSWTEYTFEFYESPTPWGPWKRFMTKDFGGYPWTRTKHGGYATTIPSKYISADGRSMWLQSNVCPCGGGGVAVYDFSLRPFNVSLYAPTTGQNPPSDTSNLAHVAGAVPEVKVAHFGNVGFLRDGNRSHSEDDWNDENKNASWWGYTFPRRYTMNKVVYTTGNMFADGGWFASHLRVQVRRDFQWVDVAGQAIGPAYPYNSSAGPNKTYTFTFNAIDGDGVRIVGVPGGSRTFTSVGELAVYHANNLNIAADPGFEGQASSTLSWPWSLQGDGPAGVDRGLGFAHSGANNAYIRAGSRDWNAILQTVNITPNTNYRLTGWLRTSGNVNEGYFGIRAGTSPYPYSEVRYGPLGGYTHLTVNFNSGGNSMMTIFAGYWAPGADSWIQLDDVTLAQL